MFRSYIYIQNAKQYNISKRKKKCNTKHTLISEGTKEKRNDRKYIVNIFLITFYNSSLHLYMKISTWYPYGVAVFFYFITTATTTKFNRVNRSKSRWRTLSIRWLLYFPRFVKNLVRVLWLRGKRQKQKHITSFWGSSSTHKFDSYI